MSDLGLPEMTLPQLIEYVRQVPFEPAMIAVSRLQAELWDIYLDGTAQLELARSFFGDGELVRRFGVYLKRHPGGVLYSEQELFIVQRLLIEHAAEGDLESGMTDGTPLIAAIVSARSIADRSHLEMDSGSASDGVVLAYLIQNGAYFERRNPMNAMARAYALFIEGSRATASAPWACPLDEWAGKDYRLTLDEQLAAGVALQAGSRVLSDVEPSKKCLVDAQAALSSTALKGRHGDVAAMLSAPRDWYAAEFAQRGSDLRAIAWHRTPFEKRPFIEFGDGRFGLISPRTIEAWLTDGFYYRMLDSAKRRTTKKRKTVAAYQSAVGRLQESWALDLIRSVPPTERPAGGGEAYGEQRYGKGRLTPDIAVDLGTDLVLFEVRSGYLREETRVSGRPQDFIKDLDRLLLRKIRQLGERAADILAGSAPIPGVDIKIVERVWPVVVTATLTQSEYLNDLIQRELTAPYGDPRVQGLVIMDIEDLELLIGMHERSGRSIADLLAARQASPFAQLELVRWAQEDPGAPIQARPASSEARWDRAFKQLLELLGFPEGAQEVARERERAENPGLPGLSAL